MFIKKFRVPINEFRDVQDPFNPNNYVSGKIYRNNYGELRITSVNGKYCPQTISTTPKLKYPFAFDNKLNFPPNISKVEAFEKIDGTNILQYTYNDANNKTYISYKTRFSIFINPKTKIFHLFSQMLNKYPFINELIYINYCNLSYELYGSKCPISFDYDIDLNLVLVFGIKKDQTIISPSQLISKSIDKPKKYYEFIPCSEKDLQINYNKTRGIFEKQLEKIGEGIYKGTEGVVWYCHINSLKGNFISMYKLKPPTIERFHMNKGKMRMISDHAIITTLKNIQEDLSFLTFGNIFDYFLEEYTEKEIYQVEYKIQRYLKKLNKI